MPRLRPLVLAAALACALPALAGAAAPYPDDLSDLSIEELANIQVTSVSKRPERLFEAAASVYVITADDIRRSGAATLPEALRLAPNLQVAQANGSSYAITARGMNGGGNSAPNKLLVLIDGRSVYTPLFSGVFWDAQDVLLEDIDRIEVISGPGATLWGVNAFNGVINITTRAAGDTRGSLAVLRRANNGADLAFRQGGGSGGRHWRVYGKAQGRDHTRLASGAAVDDAWRQAQVGFRSDWEQGADAFSFNGNAYRGTLEQPQPGTFSVGRSFVLGDIQTRGANLTGHWTHALEGGASVSVQGYLDHTGRDVPPTFAESLDIADLQFQHSLTPWGMHRVVWGANYRRSWDRVDSSAFVAFLPARLSQAWASLFAQDEITLGKHLRATLGARFERNDYTGGEFLPSARLSWDVAPGHALWAAASRTVRAPSRLDVDAFVPGLPPYVLAGNRAVRSEVAKVIELGYRGQPSSRISYAVTAYYNRYDHLRTQELLPSRTAVRFDNLMQGHTSGIEMWGNYQLTEAWRLSAGLTALHQRLQLKAGSNDSASLAATGLDPSHTAQLRSTWVLDDARDFELGVRKVAALAVGAVPAYTALDARFGWRLQPGLELSLSAQNMNGSHAEYGRVQTRAEIPRTVALKLVWQR
ncbi:MAG TPA: TonB-dependent receptor [Telluria sp.]